MIQTRDDGSRTSLRTVEDVAWVGAQLGRSRDVPGYSIRSRLDADEAAEREPSGGVVETRRLELLTLSLQRRCSAS